MRAQRRRATVRDSGKLGATTEALRRARSSQGTIGLLHLSVKPFYVNITPRDEIEHTRRNKGKHTRALSTSRGALGSFPAASAKPSASFAVKRLAIENNNSWPHAAALWRRGRLCQGVVQIRARTWCKTLDLFRRTAGG